MVCDRHKKDALTQIRVDETYATGEPRLLIDDEATGSAVAQLPVTQ